MQFARVRVRAAHRDYCRPPQRAAEWLLIEWPKGETEPAKYWLSTLADDIAFGRLIETAKLRWRIERDYQELEQEVGLGHFEGRGWRGFHHYATLYTTSQPTDSWSPGERRFPPQALGTLGRLRSLRFPQITDSADLPLRTRRHLPNSIATMR